MYVEGPNSKVHPFDITYNFFFLLQNIKKMTAAALKKDGQEFFISSKKIRMNDEHLRLSHPNSFFCEIMSYSILG